MVPSWGKIAFYSGILPVLENEAGMAFVMGHEVGHAMARHGAERISQQATMIGGLTALYLYLDNKSDMPDEARNMLMAALGVGVELGIMLPFSRAHEKEADVMGMMYMANAGYPPTESIDVWTRMSANRKGLEIPAFFVHPPHTSSENRTCVSGCLLPRRSSPEISFSGTRCARFGHHRAKTPCVFEVGSV